MSEQLRLADYVLMIASPSTAVGPRGAPTLARDGAWATRAVVPPRKGLRRVGQLVSPGAAGAAAQVMSGKTSRAGWAGTRRTYYSVPTLDNAGIEQLLRVLFKQPWETEPPIGTRPAPSAPPLHGLPRLATGSRHRPVRRLVDRAASRDVPLTEDEHWGRCCASSRNVFSEEDAMDLVLDRVGLERIRRDAEGARR